MSDKLFRLLVFVDLTAAVVGAFVLGFMFVQAQDRISRAEERAAVAAERGAAAQDRAAKGQDMAHERSMDRQAKIGMNTAVQSIASSIEKLAESQKQLAAAWQTANKPTPKK